MDINRLKKLAGLNESAVSMSGNGYINFAIYCNSGRYDENWFVKARSAADAKRAVAAESDFKIKHVSEMDEEYMEVMEINPDEHEPNVPYLFDEGT